MTKTRLTLLACAVSFGIASVPTTAMSQTKTLKDQLVGTWQAVSIILTRPDGKKIHPFTEKIQGILILTSDGHSALINTRPDVAKIASNNRIDVTTDEATSAYRGAYSYFGTYTVNEAEKSFTIKVAGSSFPNEVGTETKRIVTSVTPSELKFTNAAGAGGGSVEATFRRAK